MHALGFGVVEYMNISRIGLGQVSLEALIWQQTFFTIVVVVVVVVVVVSVGIQAVVVVVLVVVVAGLKLTYYCFHILVS